MTLNLVQHRSGTSIWEKGAASERDTERWLLAVVAGACIFAGVRRGSLAGLLLAAGGASLGWWATTGLDARAKRRAQIKQVWPRRRPDDDTVSEASKESFPASDAPSWTTGNR